MASKTKRKGSWGGRREGSGRKRKPLAHHLEQGTYRPSRHGPRRPERKRLPLRRPLEVLARVLGIGPRQAQARPDLAERFEVVAPGDHFALFTARFCRHTQEVEDGPPVGAPFELEEFQREFLDEALKVDDQGRRVYRRAGLLIPRKNGKTALSAALSLYMGGPFDGEARPLVVLAAGSRDQAGELHEHATAFITDPAGGSPALRRLFEPMKTAITCLASGGTIRRVAGDGKLNHSLNPHVVIADELHAWRTPRQRENWKALTTAQGGRRDPLVLFISTEDEDGTSVLGELLERIHKSKGTEAEHRRPGLTIYQNAAIGLLVFEYAVPAATPLGAINAWKAANPASWRTPERIALDLADPFVDEHTKRRLYGNERTGGADRWISDAMWDAVKGAAAIPAGVVVATGVDAARTRDTTALAWAWKRDDDSIVLRCRVWAARLDAAAHVPVPGGRLDNDLVRDHLRDVVMRDNAAQLLFYDERYFDTQAADLSRDGMTAVEMHQGKPEMQAAWDEFYDAVYHGQVEIADDPVLYDHIRAAVGVKTERGWKVSKVKSERPIDGLAAMVMAHYGCKHFTDYRKPRAQLLSW